MRSIHTRLLLGLATGTMLVTGPVLADDITTQRSSIRERASHATQVAKEDLKESMLNARVRLALLKGMSGADGLRVKVTVRKSVVYLSGEVKERASEKLASEMAQSVPGVTTVKSTIRLNPDAPQQDGFEAEIRDSILASEVKMRLLQEVGDNAMNINVEAASGVVSLRGTVPNKNVEKTAVKQVEDMGGVSRVEDLLSTSRPEREYTPLP